MNPTYYLIANLLLAMGAFVLTGLQPLAQRVHRFINLLIITDTEDGAVRTEIVPIAESEGLDWRS